MWKTGGKRGWEVVGRQPNGGKSVEKRLLGKGKWTASPQTAVQQPCTYQPILYWWHGVYNKREPLHPFAKLLMGWHGTLPQTPQPWCPWFLFFRSAGHPKQGVHKNKCLCSPQPCTAQHFPALILYSLTTVKSDLGTRAQRIICNKRT